MFIHYLCWLLEASGFTCGVEWVSIFHWKNTSRSYMGRGGGGGGGGMKKIPGLLEMEEE